MMRDKAAEADGKIDLNSQRKTLLQSSVLTKDRLIVKKQLNIQERGIHALIYISPLFPAM